MNASSGNNGIGQSHATIILIRELLLQFSKLVAKKHEILNLDLKVQIYFIVETIKSVSLS